MTTAVKPRFRDYAENGETVQWSVPFAFADPRDIKAQRTAASGQVTAMVYAVDYTVSGGETDAGGTLTATVPAAAGTQINIWSETARGQTADYDTNDTFPAETHEARLDQLDLIAQDQDREIARSPQVPRGENPPPFASLQDISDGDILEYRDGKFKIKDPAAFAGKYYAGDGDGRMIPASGTGGGDEALRGDLASTGAAAEGARLIGDKGGISILTTIGKLSFLVDRYKQVSDPDDTLAVQRAIAAASVSGGRVQFDGSKTYTITDELLITASNVILDADGAVMQDGGRFRFVGDSGVDGDWSSALSGVGIRNMQFGDGFYGPIFSWCRDIEVRHLERRADGAVPGTFLNVLYVRGGSVERIRINDSDADKIGVLGLHSDDIDYNGIHGDGGSYVYFTQIKGGKRNTVRNGEARGIKCKHIWRMRGDAPFQASSTTGTYPFATGAWTDTLDERRATNRCSFENLAVVDCLPRDEDAALDIDPGEVCTPFFAQEFTDCSMDVCETDGSGLVGFAVIKTKIAGEYGMKLRRCEADGEGTSAGLGISIEGYSSGSPIDTVDLFDGIVVEDCLARRYTSGSGIRLKYCREPVVTRSEATGCTGQIGIELFECSNFLVENPRADGNAIGLQAASLNVEGYGRISHPRITNSTTKNLNLTDPHTLDLGDALLAAEITGNGTNNLLLRFSPPEDSVCSITAHFFQLDTATGNVRETQRRATVKNDGGTLSWVGAGEGTAPYDEDASSGALYSSLVIGGDEVRLNLGSTLGGSVVSRHQLIRTEMKQIGIAA